MGRALRDVLARLFYSINLMVRTVHLVSKPIDFFSYEQNSLDPPKYRRNASSADAENLLQEAEQCFRCARIQGLKKEIAEGLEAAGNELMEKVVEIETIL